MGGGSVIDYLIRDPNSVRNSISDFSIGSKQSDSYHCPLFFKLSNGAGLRLLALFSQRQVLRPNPKKANQYVLYVKHEITYMQDGTYISLDEHA